MYVGRGGCYHFFFSFFFFFFFLREIMGESGNGWQRGSVAREAVGILEMSKVENGGHSEMSSADVQN